MSDILILYTGPVVTREEATAKSLLRYFTGTACANRHIAQRRTKSGICVECGRIIASRYYKAHEQVIADRRRAIPAERKRRWNRDYQNRHPERAKRLCRERKARERARKPKMNYSRVKAWREKNWEATLAQCHRRRKLIRSSTDHFKADDVRHLICIQKGRCANCPATLRRGYHIDHIVPIALGGSNSRRNIQLLCRRCNLRKGAKDPIRWALENGRLV